MTPERLEEIREASRKFQTRLTLENLQHELLAQIDALAVERDAAMKALEDAETAINACESLKDWRPTPDPVTHHASRVAYLCNYYRCAVSTINALCTEQETLRKDVDVSAHDLDAAHARIRVLLDEAESAKANLKACGARVRELEAALKAVTPLHHALGECWCSVGRDIEHCGHEEGCKLARAALEEKYA